MEGNSRIPCPDVIGAFRASNRSAGPGRADDILRNAALARLVPAARVIVLAAAVCHVEITGEP